MNRGIYGLTRADGGGNIANHASTHASGASDAITINTSQISNFNSSVSGLVSGIYQPLLIDPISGVGASGYLTKWNGSNSVGSGLIYDNGTRIGIGTNNPSAPLDVVGNTNIDGNLVFDSFTESLVVNGNSGSGISLNISSGTVHTCTLTNNCTFTMPTVSGGKSFTIFLNTGSGNYTASFAGVLWNHSSAPTITTASNKVDILSFISDGTYWYGSYSQNYG